MNHHMNQAIPISRIMTTDLVVIKASDSLKVAADAFRKNNIHHLPVVDGDSRLVGIFSKSDMLRVGSAWTAFQKKKSGNLEAFDLFNEKITIGEVMTREVVRLAPEDPLSVAVGIFRENIFHSLPIVDKGVLVGLVTTFDLLKYAFEENGLG